MSSWWSITKRLWKLRRRPVVARRRGADFLLSPRDFIDNRLLAGQPYENEQIVLAARMIAERGLDRVVDIGANFGLYTVLLGQLPTVREVTAFEPVRATANKLRANLFLNGLDAKVELHVCALSDAAGEASIHIDPHSTGVSRFDLSDAGHKQRQFTASETVRLARFDDLVPATAKPAYVKIDVEGHTAEVLRGMTAFLAAAPHVLQIEVFDDDRATVVPFLEAQGYTVIHRMHFDHWFARP